MDADWMYASYHYSHPILSERLGALGWASAKKGSASVSKSADAQKPLKAADREL
jgi:STE24 endopeptidase